VNERARIIVQVAVSAVGALAALVLVTRVEQPWGAILALGVIYVAARLLVPIVRKRSDADAENGGDRSDAERTR
jgi:hypothetical protein